MIVSIIVAHLYLFWLKKYSWFETGVINDQNFKIF